MTEVYAKLDEAVAELESALAMFPPMDVAEKIRKAKAAILRAKLLLMQMQQ